MPINSNIAMSIRPPEFESPLNQIAQLMQLEGARNQNRLADLQFKQHQQTQDDAKSLNALYSRFVKQDGTIDQAGLIQAAAQENMGSKIPVFQKQFAETAEAQGKRDTQQLALVDAKLKQSRGFLDGVTTPEQYIAWHEGNHKDPILGPMLAARGVTAEQSRAKIAQALQTPGGLEKLIAESKLGAEKFMELNKPSYQTVDSGKTKTMYAIPGLIGAPSAVNTTQMTTTPGDDLRSSDAAKGRSQSASQHSDNLQVKKEANRIAGEGQQSSGTPVLGAPVPAVLPWSNQSNPKDANKVKANEQTRGAKEIEKDLDAARKERDAAAAAKRFLELNKGTNTGGLLDRMGVTRGLQSLGADYSEMESITAKLAPAMRAEGSGSTSDFDGKQFERATVGVDKPGPTNQNIAKGVIARAQQSEEYADFRQTYLEQNGTLQGADRFWKDYANKNPIFDPAKEGTFELNKARKPWKEHFKAGKPTAAPAGAGLSAEEAAELADLRKRLGK